MFAQMIIGKPSLVFTKACANPVGNTFDLRINFSATPSLNASNQFIIELSSPTGDFSAPKILYTTAMGEVVNSDKIVSVSFPTTTFGEQYRIRVKSTMPAATGQNSDFFGAYYKPHDEQFTINNANSQASYCQGGSYVLSIDPNANGITNSPLAFPELTYNWFQFNGDTVPPTVLATASTSSYTVTKPGIYYVETNYGTCTSNSYSNRVEVTASGTTASASITSSQGNPFCPSQGATILSTSTGSSYQWFKDNAKIDGATSQTYAATTAGLYSVAIDFGGCNATATIQLQQTSSTSSIDVPDRNTIASGDSLLVTVTTDAVSPTYQWFLNGESIPNATQSSYSATLRGNYKVVVSQAGTCNSENVLQFAVAYTTDPNIANIPNLISPNGDFINDTWIIPTAYTSGSNTKIVIISSNGDVVLQTDNYQNDWPTTALDFKNINPIYYYIITTKDNKTVKGSITVMK